MRKICSWCESDLPGSNLQSQQITNGICQPCYTVVLSGSYDVSRQSVDHHDAYTHESPALSGDTEES